MYATPYFANAGIEWFYESDYYRRLYDNENFVETCRPMLERGTGEHILSLIGKLKKPGASVVEIGCGAGWNLVTLKRHGYVVRGFEYSRELVKLGRAAGLDLHEGGMPAATGQYDVVATNQVLEHVPDFVGFVTKLKSLMKPDGVLYTGVPDIEVFGPGQFQNAHCYYFTPNTLRHYMGREGLFTDDLQSYVGVGIHGTFVQRDGKVVSLAGEYDRVKAITARRLPFVRFVNAVHHMATYVP